VVVDFLCVLLSLKRLKIVNPLLSAELSFGFPGFGPGYDEPAGPLPLFPYLTLTPKGWDRARLDKVPNPKGPVAMYNSGLLFNSYEFSKL